MNRAARVSYLFVVSIVTFSFISIISFETSGQDVQAKMAQAEDLNRQAIIRVSEKRFAEAIELLTKAVGLEPKFAEAHMNIGSAYLLSGRPEDAIEHLRKGLSFDPKSHKGNNQLGVVYEKLGRLDDAVAAFNRAIKLKPDYPLAHFNLGAAYLWANKLKQADLWLHKAARLDPTNDEIKLYVGVLYAKQDRFREAIAEVRPVTQRQPGHDEANLTLCKIYLLANDRESALNLYQNFKAVNVPLADEMFKSIYSDKIVFVSDKAKN